MSTRPSIHISAPFYEGNKYVYTDEIEMFTGLETGRVLINDKDVVGALNVLFKQKYHIIGKSGNGISFLRWSNLDAGRGIVYSLDGSAPDESSLPFLTEIKPLSEEGWYFYVEDFNEWRRRHNA
jgi:hypothetical protein